MSEEIRKPEREINEAELAGVSGGVSATSVKSHVCEHCVGNFDKHCCLGGAEQLAEYINQTKQSVHYTSDCPFLRR